MFAEEKTDLGRHFSNKIWNAGRFLLLNREQLAAPVSGTDAHLDLGDRWILSRLHSTIEELNRVAVGLRGGVSRFTLQAA